jgi:glycosyltransferase involved in cell wall biosynthesis
MPVHFGGMAVNSMKVLHLIGGGDVGGAKVHVLSLVKELSKHIDVKIISFRPGAFADDAKSMNIDIEVVKTSNIFRDIKRVVNTIKKDNYQVIHSHGAKANMISLIARLFVNVPTVTTVHSDYKLDYMHSTVKRLVFGSINTIALRFMGYYIGVSSNFKNMLIERNFPPENIFVLYNGMDFNKHIKTCSRQELSRKYNLNICEDDTIVGIAARLYPVKGIGTLIEAAKIVSEKNPHVKFLIGGDGEERKSLEKKVLSLGLTDNVFFLGWLDDPYELMSNVDISVLTSISESFPYSILEGAKFKKATISSRVGGIPDLIDHNINGYLFNAGDYKKLSEHILELAVNKAKRDEMGGKIYQKASTMFSLDNMCNTQLSIYKTILEKAANDKTTKNNYDVIISGYYGFQNIGDDANVSWLLDRLSCNKVTFGLNSKNAMLSASNISFSSDGTTTYTLIMNKKEAAEIKLRVTGIHNVSNSLAAIASCYTLGCDLPSIKRGLYSYTGVHQRFELIGVVNNIKIIDDYAHHPSEVKATLKGAKNCNPNKIWCVFQPHTYSRTKFLLDEFATSFSDADTVIVTDIYAAREVDNGEIHSSTLAKLINSHGTKAIYISDFNEIAEYLQSNASTGDLIITMGAGNVGKVGEVLIKNNEVKAVS